MINVNERTFHISSIQIVFLFFRYINQECRDEVFLQQKMHLPSSEDDDNTSVTFSSPSEIEFEDQDLEDDQQEPGYKRRIRFTAEEQAILCKAYRKNPKPSKKDKIALAERLDTSFKRVQVWFQNKRAKEKREHDAARQHESQRQKLQQQRPSSSSTSSASPMPTDTSETTITLKMYRS